MGLVAPEQGPLDERAAGEHGQQVHAVGQIGGVGRGAGGRQQGRHEVHGDRDLLAGYAGGNARGPTNQRRNAQSPFQQFGLAAGERPRIREALAAVVAGKDDDGVLDEPMRVERRQHAADLAVHRRDHAGVDFLGTAVEVAQVGAGDAPGFRLVPRRLPRPMRRVEVQADEEWAA